MRREIDGRVVLFCDRCKSRLDFGAAKAAAVMRERLPSGWVKTGANEHLCNLCSSGAMHRFLRQT
jgi:hypothetical protein